MAVGVTGAIQLQVGRTLMDGAIQLQAGETQMDGAIQPQAGKTTAVFVGATLQQAGRIRVDGLIPRAGNERLCRTLPCLVLR